MKYLDEYRSRPEAERYARLLRSSVTRPWSLMEVCGGQTHSIVRFGIDSLLPPEITLLHGPGCPVCVTPVGMIDYAIELAARPDVLFCSYGDMLRVPGSERDLFSVKAAGFDVRMVYSAMDALALAEKNQHRQIVFFAVGFETTAPAHAAAVAEAKRRGLGNFSMLVSHVLVPPAVEALLSSPESRIQGLLAAGHVCTIMGTAEYEPISARFGVPIAVTGFEPLDLLQGIALCVRRLEEGRPGVDIQYARAVRPEGNVHAKRMLQQMFEIEDREWRGIGVIPNSGFRLRPEWAAFDALRRFGGSLRFPPAAGRSSECISGLVLQGLKKPSDCKAFGTSCTPEQPAGATMVSSEGACAAYYRYRSPFSKNLI